MNNKIIKFTILLLIIALLIALPFLLINSNIKRKTNTIIISDIKQTKKVNSSKDISLDNRLNIIGNASNYYINDISAYDKDIPLKSIYIKFIKELNSLKKHNAIYNFAYSNYKSINVVSKNNYIYYKDFTQNVSVYSINVNYDDFTISGSIDTKTNKIILLAIKSNNSAFTKLKDYNPLSFYKYLGLNTNNISWTNNSIKNKTNFFIYYTDNKIKFYHTFYSDKSQLFYTI